jgi:type IV secretory pathway VirB10-like protein
MFVWLVVLLVMVITIALALVLSAPGPQPTVADAATNDADDRGDNHTYGKSAQATPTPFAARPYGVGGSQNGTAMTPAPGITPCNAGAACVTVATNTANNASAAYGQAAAAAVTAGGTATVPGVGGAVPQIAQPIPQATVLIVTPDSGGTSSATALGSTGDALSTLRANLAAQEAALTSSGNSSTNVPGIDTQRSVSVSPTATPRETGLLGTPILPPPAFAVPMGTCLKASLKPNLDSSLAGPVTASIDQTYYDPRNREPVIPGSATVTGHYVGLAGGATHLGITWDWIEYPDLEKRQLTVDVATTATSGENGLPGRVNTHLWQQFRNTFVNAIVGASGQILVAAATKGSTTTIQTGSQPEVTVPGSNVVPTLYTNRATPFCLLLTVDYDAAKPYTGSLHE